MPPNEVERTDLQPIADIDRLTILAVLYVVENADFVYLRHQTGLTGGNLSSHLSRLEAAGYVDIKKEFADKMPRTLLRLTDEGREAFEAYRQDMMRVLEDLAE
jgi:DNA-binding MarR family transcriptional regulator